MGVPERTGEAAQETNHPAESCTRTLPGTEGAPTLPVGSKKLLT